MNIMHAIILGAVQGITEFVPISSTAHLFLVQELMHIENNAQMLAFDIVLHLGTALSLIIIYWKDLWSMVFEFFRFIMHKPAKSEHNRAMILPIIIGTIPGAFAGMFLLDDIAEARSTLIIGMSMLVACGYFLFSEKMAVKRTDHNREKVTIWDSVWVGIAQGAAGLMAGFSRSGFTISTGRLRGLRRDHAARFSFLLSLPIILGAGVKAIFDLRGVEGVALPIGTIIAGFVASAIVGYLAVKFLLKFLRTHTLKTFAIYLGALGSTLVIWNLIN